MNEVACICLRHIRKSVLGLVGSALLGMTGVCFAGQAPDVYMPPNEYIHPYVGKVVLMSLPHRDGAPVLSLSHHASGTCSIWLPRIGDPGITEAVYECLAVVEVANCNGATDVNTPAVRARSSFSEQMRYARACSRGQWDWAYNAVRPSVTPTLTQVAASQVGSSRF
jgi:hypothetical protein